MSVDRVVLRNRLHAAVVAASAWLVFTSPWVALLRRIPRQAGWLDWTHVVVGVAALFVGLFYGAACVRAGGWRSYFPWLAGDWRPAARDLAGIARGRVPSAEGGGLYAVVEGLLLLALLVAGLTGVGWLVAQGGAEALAWREAHLVAARTMIALAVAHVLAVATHVAGFA